MDSTRIWTSHFDKELSVSIKVPVEWEVGKNDDFKLLILSPPIDGFRANVGINVYNFKGDMASFEAAIKGAAKNLEDEYQDYHKISDEQGWIDGFPAYHQQYSWSSEDPKHDFMQSLTLIYDTSSYLFEINGTSISNLSQTYMDLLEEMIFSIRFLRN